MDILQKYEKCSLELVGPVGRLGQPALRDVGSQGPIPLKLM